MDETAFLCERCGYPLGGLARTGACPECGQAIAESAPQRRAGSAWQRSPGPGSWWRTNIGVLRRARATFREGTVESRRSGRLLLLNCAFAGVLVALPWAGILIGDPARGPSGAVGAALLVVMLAVWTLMVGGVLAGLTLVEHVGVRFFAARRKWRLTKDAAWMVCGHATVGWVLGPLLAFLGLAGLYSLERFFGISPRGSFRFDLGPALDLGWIGWADLVYSAILGGSALAGLVAFEVLVYLGVRECRFANGPGVGSAPTGVPTGAEPIKSA